MTKMTRSASTSWQQSQFDDFLHAPIGHEKNGMLLTVLSALARLDLDPWGEAANLAQLPTEAATERMRSLVAAVSEEPATASESESVAARLVALLPTKTISAPGPRKANQTKTNPRETLQRVGLPNNARFFLFVAIVAVLLSMQISMASRQSPAHPDPSPTAGFSGSSEAGPKP